MSTSHFGGDSQDVGIIAEVADAGLWTLTS